MRIAVLADIHGNLDALDAVMADLRETAPDLVVNLGDCLSGPLDARGTAERLMDLGWPTVRGNHDRHLVEHAEAEMGASDRAAAAAIGPAERSWLRALPATLALAPGLFLCHGTPAEDDRYLLEAVGTAGPAARRPAEVDTLLGPLVAGVVLCGHSHVPRLVRLPSGRMVLNPGSVGLQAYHDDTPRPHDMAVGSPHARYAVMDRRGDGWSFAFRAVVYDWDAAAARAAAAGRPDWATALATGWTG